VNRNGKIYIPILLLFLLYSCGKITEGDEITLAELGLVELDDEPVVTIQKRDDGSLFFTVFDSRIKGPPPVFDIADGSVACINYPGSYPKFSEKRLHAYIQEAKDRHEKMHSFPDPSP
jgi:hypothetical protein